jgi:predicted O-methyltransferase YrrM
MTQETWTAVDRFLTDLVVQPVAALADALAANHAAELPEIDVSPPLGKLLRLLAEAIRAQRILEIGTLGGYSTIWMAQALPPNGKLISLEFEQKHADVARANIERAGLAAVVDIRVGRAIDALPKLHAENVGPFDLVFIDADKVSTPEYFAWALKLTRRGSVIIVDNVVRSGAVLEADSNDEAVQGVRRFLDQLAHMPGILATALQTVGAKGYDGFAIVLVTDDRPRP